MNSTQFWKNFRLQEELSISGAFIYRGMRCFHEMRRLDCGEEVFEVLYNLSVGFERLLKVAVVLLEHDDLLDQDKLERSLITHGHLDLLRRVKRHVPVLLAAPHNDLLALLGKFYKTLRYGRFSLSSAYHAQRETGAICVLLEKHLKVAARSGDSCMACENTEKFRQFMRRTILKIASTIYKVIRDRAAILNIYTYELRNGSKAESVFLRGVDISDEDTLWKELLIFFMNAQAPSKYLEFLRGIAPLGFDPALVGEYLECFRSDDSKAIVMDELEELYQELENRRERLKLLSYIANPNVCFDAPDDELDV